MKLVKVLIPFCLKETNEIHAVGDEIKLTDEQLERVKAININMVKVLGEAEEEKPKKTRKKN